MQAPHNALQRTCAITVPALLSLLVLPSSLEVRCEPGWALVRLPAMRSAITRYASSTCTAHQVPDRGRKGEAQCTSTQVLSALARSGAGEGALFALCSHAVCIQHQRSECSGAAWRGGRAGGWGGGISATLPQQAKHAGAVQAAEQPAPQK